MVPAAAVEASAVVPAQDEPAVPPAVAPAGAAAAPFTDPLPNVALSSDLLYKLTKAELEFKTGRWQGPYITLMGLAHQTRDPRLAHRAADMALTAKQSAEALAGVRLWRELAPHSDEANQYFLGFIVVSDQLAEAEPLLRQRLERATPSGRSAVMFQIQQLLGRAKDKPAGFAMLERLLAPYPALMESHLVLAHGAFVIGDRQRATQEAQQALRIKPDSELAVLTLAQAALDVPAASAVLTDYLAQHPGAREVRAAYARLLLEQKQYGPAQVQFSLLLQSQPDDVASLYALGIVAMQMNQTPAAETYFKQFLAVQAAHPNEESEAYKVQILLSQIAEERGDLPGALVWINQIEGGDPKVYFAATIRRAQLMAKSGDLDGGRKVLAEMSSDSIDEQAQILMADAQLLRDGGYDQSALAVLANGLKRFPGNAELLYDFAMAAEKMGQFEAMETSLRQVIAQNPDNRQAYNALGFSLADRNVRLPEAYSLIDTALKMAPDDPFIIDSMGWVQFRLGRLSEAEVTLRRAYTLRDDPEIASHLGEVLWQKGDKIAAQTLWRAALAKDPKNDTLKNTLARLNASV